MLLEQAKAPWADDSYCAMLKLDGWRGMADIQGAQVELRTRGGSNATRWWPEVCAGLSGLTTTRTVLDGEVVVLDEWGRSDFPRMNERSRRRRWYPGADPVVFFVFDALIVRGKDVRQLPLKKRLAMVARLLAKERPSVRICKHVPGRFAPELFEKAKLLRLEGIVMKRLDSPYVGGEPRTDHWVKIKRRGATPAGKFTRDTALPG